MIIDSEPAHRIKIALSTVGSTGDIQPFLALGVALMERGHDVVGISHPFHAERFLQNGIPFRPCGLVVEQSELNELLDRMMSKRNPIKQLQILMREALFAEAGTYLESAKSALKDRELIISHMIDFLGQEAAAQLGIPIISVVLTHSIIPTKVSSPAILPNLGALNPLAWKAMTAMMRGTDREAMAKLGELGGPSIKIERYASLSPELNFLAASETLAGIPSEHLPPHVVCTGPWILNPKASIPDPALESFLQRNPKPVVVSLGSMGGNKGPEFTKIILEALALSGKPAVIQSGYAGLTWSEPPENVYFAGFISHEYLFPQASCVVHHGGAGTTAATCRAGVPSVVVAFIADQPYFAKRLRKTGLAPKMIWQQNLSARKLSKAIDIACGATMQARAAELKPRFLAETGTEKAIEIIEAFWKKKSTHFNG